MAQLKVKSIKCLARLFLQPAVQRNKGLQASLHAAFLFEIIFAVKVAFEAF